MSYSLQKTCQISPRRHKNQLVKHQKKLKFTETCCLSCIMDDPDPSATLKSLWSIALAKPDDAEFPSLGVFQCMAKLIDKCIKNREWFSRGKNNVYIPYYAAHIIGSYTMNKATLADLAVKSGVVPPLMELLRGKISWVEQRVAVRALGHIASHRRGFIAVAIHEEEIINLAMKISSSCFETVYAQFLSLKAEERVGYHRHLLGRGWLEMENKKAEEWAHQLRSWSLYLINCFAIKRINNSIDLICNKEFLEELCFMWGGLQSTNSFSGVCLIRSVCVTKDGRRSVANSKAVVESLCNLSRSSDEGQRKAIESILLLLQDRETRDKVMDLVAPFMVDLVELKIIRGRRRRGRINVGDAITRLILQDYRQTVLKSEKSQNAIEELWDLKVERRERDAATSGQEFRQRVVKVSALKREGNEKFWAGDAGEAATRYAKALELCPMKMKKERIVLHSNRAQCYLVLREAELAISDATRALCLSGVESPHMKSLWRRSQAYDMLGMARQSLTDCLAFINENTKLFKTKRHVKPKPKVPYYAVRMLNKQITATNPFGVSTLSAKTLKKIIHGSP